MFQFFLPIFQFQFSVFFHRVAKCDPIMGCCQVGPGAFEFKLQLSMLKFLKLAQFSESFKSHLFLKSISKIQFTIYSFSCFASFVPCLVNDSAEVQAEVATQVTQYRPKRIPVGQRLSQCGIEGTVARMSWEVIDQANTNVKLMTLGALYI